eukprot:gene16355-biopygen3766
MKNTWWVGVDRSCTPQRVFYGEPNHMFPGFPGLATAKVEGAGRGPPPTHPRRAGRAGQPNWGGSGGPTARPRCGAATEEIENEGIHDTSLQWHSTLGLVPHLIGPTAGGLISQSQFAGKCTNDVTDTTKLNETARTASKSVGN